MRGRLARVFGPLCPRLDAKRVVLDERPGGHHFDGDYGAIAARIAAEIE